MAAHQPEPGPIGCAAPPRALGWLIRGGPRQEGTRANWAGQPQTSLVLMVKPQRSAAPVWGTPGTQGLPQSWPRRGLVAAGRWQEGPHFSFMQGDGGDGDRGVPRRLRHHPAGLSPLGTQQGDPGGQLGMETQHGVVPTSGPCVPPRLWGCHFCKLAPRCSRPELLARVPAPSLLVPHSQPRGSSWWPSRRAVGQQGATGQGTASPRTPLPQAAKPLLEGDRAPGQSPRPRSTHTSPVPPRPRRPVLTWTMALEPITSRTCPLRLVPLGSMKLTISAYWANCRDRVGVRWGGLLSPSPTAPCSPHPPALPTRACPPVLPQFPRLWWGGLCPLQPPNTAGGIQRLMPPGRPQAGEGVEGKVLPAPAPSRSVPQAVALLPDSVSPDAVASPKGLTEGTQTPSPARSCQNPSPA